MNTYTKEKDMENAAKEKISEYASSAEAALRQGESKTRESMAELEKKVRQGQEQLKQALTSVDKQLHQNPWPIVSAVAVACIFFGFFMGTSKRND
jgi:ElaB/YqjD/DUF883 family membrane-anchored ribosome-binding protein